MGRDVLEAVVASDTTIEQHPVLYNVGPADLAALEQKLAHAHRLGAPLETF
jgi:hypothetical protein